MLTGSSPVSSTIFCCDRGLVALLDSPFCDKAERRLTVGQTTTMGIRIAVVQRTLTPLVGVQLSHPQPRQLAHEVYNNMGNLLR